MFTAAIPVGHELRGYAVPIKARPHRLVVGLRPTSRWLLPGPDSPGQVAHKQRLLATRGPELIAVLPEPWAHDATYEAAGSVGAAAGLAREGFAPTHASAREALAAVATQISEDVCVMVRRDDTWRLAGVGVLFPSHWSPRVKLGQGLEAIHDPVPGYDRIAGATAQAFERIAGGSGVWERFNWTLTTDTQLCHTGSEESPRVGQPDAWPPVRAEDLWLRVERQTLTALSADVVVFLIRTFLTPLVALDDAERAAVVTAITGVSTELAEYRRWVGYREVVKQWVAQR